eukprot:CAMPEP_0178653774 /NCGR_PEP_ID=MMETSP0698-20121128/23387_1 /TAXON_ID=265572 /ORGANISM="Extubocellulus spinifer, Strain CCMP396" /LENGTH=370 /DNA_ID=CAMNT_0020295619 /DNA_START=24 /DNA_END=1133 /DNA_ORIENTATION=+
MDYLCDSCTWCSGDEDEIVCMNDMAYKVCLSKSWRCGQDNPSGIEKKSRMSKMDYLCDSCTWCSGDEDEIVCMNDMAYKVCLSKSWRCGQDNPSGIEKKSRMSKMDYLCESYATCFRNGEKGYWCSGKDNDLVCAGDQAYKVCRKNKNDCGDDDWDGVVDWNRMSDRDDDVCDGGEDFATCSRNGNKGYWCSGKDEYLVCSGDRAYKVCLKDKGDCGDGTWNGWVDYERMSYRDEVCDDDFLTCRNDNGDKGYWCGGDDDELVCWNDKAYKVCLKDKDDCGDGTWNGWVDYERMSKRDEVCDEDGCASWTDKCCDCSEDKLCDWESSKSLYKECIGDKCRSECKDARDKCNSDDSYKRFALDNCGLTSYW